MFRNSQVKYFFVAFTYVIVLLFHGIFCFIVHGFFVPFSCIKRFKWNDHMSSDQVLAGIFFVNAFHSESQTRVGNSDMDFSCLGLYQ